jgi:hypothetical protein
MAGRQMGKKVSVVSKTSNPGAIVKKGKPGPKRPTKF